MKWASVFLFAVYLSCVFGHVQKKVLLVGPEGKSLISKYCTVPTEEHVIAPLREYTCDINAEKVILITAPVCQGVKDLDTTLHSFGSLEPINLVVLLWPSSPQESFDPYVPISLSFVPYIHIDQKPFVLMSSLEEKEQGYQDFKHMIGINHVIHHQIFEKLVQSIDPSVHLRLHDKYLQKGNTGKLGCLASLNVVETKDGQKLIKDVEVGDEVLTPRGYMPIIFIEDHPNVTFPCVHYGGVWLTEDHFIYDQNVLVAAGSLANATMRVELEVRTVVVKGDSYFCRHVLVSSYSRFRWLPYFSFAIDRLPTSILALTRKATSIFL